jgi:hypothetical protein
MTSVTVTFGTEAFEFPDFSLVELPFGFDSTDVTRGRTAETLALTGLLLRADAEAVVDLYRAWREVRVLEEDPKKSGAVGTTVAVTGEGIGFDWTNVPCWFSQAPEITYAGVYARVAVSFVDAAQALEIMMEEKEDADEDGLNYGTITLGGAVINLTSYPTSYTDFPQLDRNPVGIHVISGYLSLVEIQDVEGWVSDTDLALLTSWLNTTVMTTPAADSFFPVSWSRPKVEARKSGITFNIQMQLVKIKG